jgi:transposase
MRDALIGTNAGAVLTVCLSLPTTLLPATDGLHLDQVESTDTTITLVATMTTPTAACPDCGAVAARVHSQYRRTLTDLAWAHRRVIIRLVVRRFVCPGRACARTTFAERLPDLAPRYARTTARLWLAQTDVALVLGGAAGARLLAKQGLPGSRNTLLRRIRAAPAPDAPPPQAVGIDDWALRRGHRYGSLIVDLDRRRPIAILPDRTVETVSAWFAAHRTITLVSRDRAEGYATAIRAGAPQAVQVADRFHIVRNLRDAADAALSRCPSLPWRPPAAAEPAPPMTTLTEPATPALASRLPDTPSGRQAEATRLARRAQRLARYEQAISLRHDGWTVMAIAQHLRLGRRTVERWLAAGQFPERQRRTDRSCLAPYQEYLLARWAAGCHNATRLWREVQARGYPGSYRLLVAWLAPLRPRRVQRAGEAPPYPPAPALVTARQLTFLLIRRPADRTADERARLAQVRQHDPALAQIATLVEDFAQLVRDRAPERLGPWLAAASASGHAALAEFVNGVGKDEAAVRAALESPYSTGQVEGQITKLKLVKRQGYGRAKPDLLWQRLLLAG